MRERTDGCNLELRGLRPRSIRAEPTRWNAACGLIPEIAFAWPHRTKMSSNDTLLLRASSRERHPTAAPPEQSDEVAVHAPQERFGDRLNRSLCRGQIDDIEKLVGCSEQEYRPA